MSGAPTGSARRVGQEVAVRSARVGDAQAVTALLDGIYEEGGYFVGDGPAPVSTLKARLAGDSPITSLYLVAVEEASGDVVGWLELHRGSVWRLAHVATLTLAVAAGMRRRGIGSRLLSHAYRWCAEVGAIKISLNVRAGNAAAISLYLSEGFEFEGRELDAVAVNALPHGRGHEAPVYEDNLLMAKFVAGRRVGQGGEEAVEAVDERRG